MVALLIIAVFFFFIVRKKKKSAGEKVSSDIQMGIKIIKPNNLNQIKALTELEHRCFPPEMAASYEKLKWRFENFPNLIYCMAIDHKIIAAVIGRAVELDVFDDRIYEVNDLKRGNIFAITSIMCDEEYRGMHLTTRLVNHALTDVANNGFVKATLACEKENIGYYMRFGFENKGVSKSSHGNALWYDMSKSLR